MAFSAARVSPPVRPEFNTYPVAAWLDPIALLRQEGEKKPRHLTLVTSAERIATTCARPDVRRQFPAGWSNAV